MRRSIAGLVAIGVTATSGILAGPSSASAAPGTPIPGPMLSEFQAATGALVSASMLPSLVGAVPGLGESPATLVGLHDVFGGLSMINPANELELQNQLEGIEGLLGVDFENALVEQSGDVTTMSFDLAMLKTEPAELALAADEAFLVGSAQDIGVEIATTTLTFEYDSSIGDPADAFALVAPLPSFDISLTGSFALADQDVVFGYAGATASGPAAFDVGFNASLVDPDGAGRITGTEFGTVDIADLVALDLVASGGPDVAIDLDVVADVYGTQFGAELSLDDVSIFDDDLPEPSVAALTGFESLDLLTNFSAEAAMTALTQVVSGFGAAMIGGDVDLPFLSDGVFIPGDLAESDDFDRIFEAIGPLLAYVEPRAAGQIVCGTSQMPPEGSAVAGIPFGQTLFVDDGDTVFCRAYTSSDGSGVDWEVTGGTFVGSDTKAGSVGESPTENVEFTVAGTDGFEISVDFTPDGEAPLTIVQRPETIQELLVELLDAGLIPGAPGLPDFDFDADLQAILFDLGIGPVDPVDRAVSVNAGSELVAQTGLTGLRESSGGAGADLQIGGVAAGVTVGLILTEDEADINPGDNIDFEPGPGDRVLLKGTDTLLTVDTVDLAGSIAMAGRLGFINVTAELSGGLGPAEGDSGPALSVGLGAPVGVTVDGHTDADATLVADLLRTGPTGFDLDTNLQLDATLDVSSQLGVAGQPPAVTAGGSIDIVWDLADTEPAVTMSPEFETNLFPFDTAESLTYVGGAQAAADEALFDVAPGADLLLQAGLVGSVIDDGDGNTCTVVAVLTDTLLRCENPMPVPGTDQIDQNPITFVAGESYDVSGNTLAYLSEILAGIDLLADYVEGAVGTAAFEQPIPVVGIRPADLVDHVDQLRKMVNEFRGVQDGTVNCELEPAVAPGEDDPPLDIRAIDTSAYSLADLECAVTTPANAPAAARIRLVDVVAADDDVAGPWTDLADGVVGPTPSATTQPATGGLGDLDDDGDGYITLGAEYTIEAEWTDDDEPQSAALPPRVPKSLEQLGDLVEQILHLPDDSVAFVLADAPANPTVRMTFTYGVCSDSPPASLSSQCADVPAAPTPRANLNMELGGSLPDFVGLDSAGSIEVQYAAIGTFSIGLPLLTPLEPVIYGNTGLDLAVQVGGDDLSLSASIGPANANLGVGAALSGTATNDDDDDADDATLVDAATDLSSVPIGTPVSRGSDSCLTTSAALHEVDCDIDGGETDDGWMNGDGYTIGGLGTVDGGLSFSVSVDDAGSPLGDDESLAFSSPDLGFDVTDFTELVGGSGDCGSIDPSRFDEVSVFGTADGNATLTGLACGIFSIELQIGSGEIYLGEIAFEWSAADTLTVYVPADLATRLGDALLDPAFILQALPGLLQEIEDGLRDAANSGLPAAVADPLHLGADGIGVIRIGAQELADTLGPVIAALPDAGEVAAVLDAELTDLFQPPGSGFTLDLEVSVMCGGVDCDDTHSLADIDDVSASVTFGGEWRAASGVNLGLEGLPISFEGGVEAFAGFSGTIGVGVNLTDGPYLLLNDPTTDDDPNDLLDSTVGAEFKIAAGIEIPETPGVDCEDTLADSVPNENYSDARCLKGKLVFLFIEALDRTTENGGDPSSLSANVVFDVTSSDQQVTLSDVVSGDLGIEFDAQGDIHLDFHIRTGIDIPGVTGAGDLPSLLGTFALDWGVSFGEGVGEPTIAFGNLHLDVGTFLAQFINPIASEIKKITGPLQPIIDTLMAPIPVISDLAELVGQPPVTMISLLEVATGADLSLVRSVAAFITFFNQIAGLGDDDGFQIPLGGFVGDDRAPGDFTIDAAAAAKKVAPAQATSLIGGSSPDGKGGGFVDDVAGGTGLPAQGTATDNRPTTFGVPGLSFPFLEDATQLFGLLVGSDVTLIRWDAGTLEASAGFSYDFGPIMAGPVPITITIGGEIGVRGRFAIGYDTYGIRQLLDGGSGTALFDGIFIDDLDANGNDVPEIEFFGKVFAGASVDLVIVSAGVRGGIELTFSLDLDDRPDPDGKLRIEEIVDKLQNPICLFVVSGKIEAFLEVFVEIDLFLWSEEFSFELVRVTLLEWSSACEPPEPVLSVNDGGVLTLNTGSRRVQRNIQEDQQSESIEVRQIGPNKVRVSGFGWEETRDGVNLIVADGGAGADELLFLNGTLEGTTETPQPWTIPVVVSGGPGNDIIKIEGDSADRILGDATIAGGTWLGIAYGGVAPEPAIAPDDDENKDNVNAGGGDDLVDLGPGDDSADGQAGDDTVIGGPGDDNLDGGAGADVVDGGADEDTVQGGPIEQPAPGASNAEIDDDDVLIGGSERDVASGDFGNDLIFGDAVGTGPDAVVAYNSDGDGRLARASGLDGDDYAAWCATGGSGGDDLLTGTDGDDVIIGGGGDDSIDAGKGDDHACGGPDEDTVIGGDGDDDLFGDGENDVLAGNDGDDFVRGGGGDDIAHGDDGDDTIFGDAGADLLYGDADHDIVVGDGGAVTGTLAHGVELDGHVDPSRVEAIDDALTVDGAGTGDRRTDDCSEPVAAGDSDCIWGGTGSDALFGGGDGDDMRGETGVDFLEGNGGPDLMRGGTENDVLLGSAGADTIYGDGGDDGAFGDRSIDQWLVNEPSTGAIDTIYGGPGFDHLEGDGAGDVIFGGAQDDHIEGNNGQDELHGEGGDDDLIGGSDTAFGVGDSDDVGEAAVYGGLGQDVIAGDNAIIGTTGYVLGRSVELLDIGNDDVGGADTIEGDAETDAIFGQSGDDVIWGDHGPTGPFIGTGAADYAEGNDGNDTIRGETGGDDLVGGSSTGEVDGIVDADRTAGAVDDEGETSIQGGPGRDWIAGDNARFDRVLGNGFDYPSPMVTPIQLFDLSTTGAAAPATAYGGDTVSGGADGDIVFGQGGNDGISGDDGDDYIEGNDGDDAITGDAGTDDLIGGGSANNGSIVFGRLGTGLLDGGETLVSGGDGRDLIAGDNARMNRVLFAMADYPAPDGTNGNELIRLFDLQTESNPVDAGTHGPDTAAGGSDTDVMFGQGDDDTLEGNDAPDYVEGNDGNDTIRGGDGDDDLIGGGSANDGVIDRDRIGETLHDEGETLIEGNAGADWIMGDNAFSNRVLFAATDEPIDLFDVNSDDVDVSGGDLISGGTEDDLIFGQGNGAQPVEGQPGAQSDPAGDGVDNDGDGVVDEDGLHQAGWLGDTILGDEGADYIEGNHGADHILGGSGPDDIAGGGSAIDGVIDDDRIGDGLRDGRDTIWGGTEDDVVGGDNVRILDGPTDDGPLWLTNARDVLLFDVNSDDQTVSGGDFIGGEDGADVMFGQGNGLQSADQADPLDGFDNDLDGRESLDSVEYDCFDGFDNDGDGDGLDVDGAGVGGPDPDCVAAVDEDMPWDGDVIWGGDGDDYAEGNHGADWMFGDNGQDDLIGGGSADNGHITADRTPAGLVDGSDVINGDDGLGDASPIGTGGDSDVITADNARINRLDGGGFWQLIPNATSGHDLVDRDVTMVDAPAPASDFGDDHVRGDVKHDQIYGQQGADLLEGNHGDDAVIGDLGKFVTSISAGPAQHIEPDAPFVQDDIFAASTLNHLTTLYSQETGGGAEGDDIVLGGQGHDDLHGGPGDDVMNGDLFSEHGVLPDPDLIEIVPGEFTYDEPGVGIEPYANEDAVFGGWGDDVLWGGRDPDHLYGGHGDDYIDVRPRPAGLVPGSPRDPAAWFTWVRAYDAGTDAYTEEHYQDADVALGGWGQDVLQANLADPGPNLGDRMFDSYGAHNLFYICDPHYGSYTAIRQMSPGQRQFFFDLSRGDGLDAPGSSNSSGFSELALVYPKDAKANTNPPHPETPGHFYCGPVAP